MPFVHGRETGVFVNGTDLSRYFDSVDMSLDADQTETSTFRSGGWKQFIAGQTGAKIDTSGLYDPEQMTLPPLLDAEVGALVMIVMADGTNVRSASVKSTNYTESSPVGGAVSFKWTVMADGLVVLGGAMHPLAPEAGPGTGSSVDIGPAATGATAELHATAATNLIVSIEDASVPSGGSSNWAPLAGAVFSELDAPGAQRITIAGTVRHYVRAVWTGSGTFTVAIARK